MMLLFFISIYNKHNFKLVQQIIALSVLTSLHAHAQGCTLCYQTSHFQRFLTIEIKGLPSVSPGIETRYIGGSTIRRTSRGVQEAGKRSRYIEIIYTENKLYLIEIGRASCRERE